MKTFANEEECKEWIDKATYEELLRHIRFAPLGDRLFIGDIGKYFRESMAAKRGSDAEHTAASKRIGWDG